MNESPLSSKLSTNLMTVQEVCEALQITRNTLYSLMAKEGFPSIKIGGARRFIVSQVDEFLANKAGEAA